VPDVPCDDDQPVNDRGRRDQRVDGGHRFTLHASAPADLAPCLGDDGVHAEHAARKASTEIRERLLELCAFSCIGPNDLYALANLAKRQNAEIEALFVTLVDPRAESRVRPRLDEIRDDIGIE
jgi:hypothetical protein